MMMRNFYSNDHSDAVTAIDVFGRIHAITRRKYANTEIQNTKSPSAWDWCQNLSIEVGYKLLLPSFNPKILEIFLQAV